MVNMRRKPLPVPGKPCGFFMVLFASLVVARLADKTRGQA